MARKRKRRKSPSAAMRRKHGMRGSGKFPVYSHRTAMSAIKLRKHGKGVSSSKVLSKVSRWANAHNDKAAKNAVKRARAKDRKRR